jgi:hypothetical protein
MNYYRFDYFVVFALFLNLFASGGPAGGQTFEKFDKHVLLLKLIGPILLN